MKLMKTFLELVCEILIIYHCAALHVCGVETGSKTRSDKVVYANNESELESLNKF